MQTLGTKDPLLTEIPPKNGAKAEERRYRQRFIFHLDIVKDEQFEIAAELVHLKSQKKYTPTIRDGIRLYLDLKKGSIKVLLDLFPGIEQKVVNYWLKKGDLFGG